MSCPSWASARCPERCLVTCGDWVPFSRSGTGVFLEYFWVDSGWWSHDKWLESHDEQPQWILRLGLSALRAWPGKMIPPGAPGHCNEVIRLKAESGTMNERHLLHYSLDIMYPLFIHLSPYMSQSLGYFPDLSGKHHASPSQSQLAASGALHGHVHLCGFLRLHLHREQLWALHRCTLAKLQKVGHLQLLICR